MIIDLVVVNVDEYSPCEVVSVFAFLNSKMQCSAVAMVESSPMKQGHTPDTTLTLTLTRRHR
jgi:hypothetical protein